VRLTLVNADLPSGRPAPPLGIVSLAHTATLAGHEVTLRDYQLATPVGSRDPATFAEFCGSDDPVLGVSTSGMTLPLVVLALRRLKAMKPELITVLGGIGAAGAAEQIITAFPWIDFVSCGEGEESLRELLDRLELSMDTSTVAGFVCRDGGRTRANPARPRICDLDGIGACSRNYLDLSRYAVVQVITARGCPFRCTFCDVAPYWGNRHTVRSVQAVLDEIEELALGHLGPMRFVFVDDTLTLDCHRVEALCAGLQKMLCPPQWGCYARADRVDEQLLALMRDSGCVKVYFGLESGSDGVLTQVKKGFDAETGRQAALLARQYIPAVQTSFVWGYPFETWEDFHETLLMMGYLVSQGVSVKANVLTPLPFSPLFSDYAESMVFLPDYSPELYLAGFQSRPELVALIRQYPRIFPCFYLYYSETLTRKYDLLREMSLSPEHIWALWEQLRGPVPLREPTAAA
jgi:anaerobic magnesium-protoporphyrin IX monomethyl ester cyclase